MLDHNVHRHGILLPNAKKNMRGYFYFLKGTWRNKPRINKDDKAVLDNITRSTGVKVTYEPSTNYLQFDIPTKGRSIEFSGEETGGQIIRLLVQVADQLIHRAHAIVLVLQLFMSRWFYIFWMLMSLSRSRVETTRMATHQPLLSGRRYSAISFG